MKACKKEPKISWDKIRKDFNFNAEISGRMTFYANYFMRKWIYNLSDLNGVRIYEFHSRRYGSIRVSEEGIAVLCVLCNWYDIPIKISNEEIIILEKHMERVKDALQIRKK